MAQASAILGLYAHTNICAGTGQTTGAIDLPIQREGHSGWPCVFGSAVKGALRAHAYQRRPEDTETLKLIFGPDTDNASEHAGALTVGDARLVLLPVRSLTSHFKWVTCPEALRRLRDDWRRLGISRGEWTVPEIQDESQALTPGEHKTALFLEEYRLQPQRAELAAVIKDIARMMERDDAEAALGRQLVIVADDMFAHLVQHATPVNAHVRIDPETKTVARGGLWYEESLPPDTLLYTALNAGPARKQDAKQPADAILNGVTSLFSESPWLQLGGNETVGMGWCATRTVGGQ